MTDRVSGVPRRARVVFPGLPHHVTQRGNQRQRVFFSHGDHAFYLDALYQQVREGIIEVIAYCLKSNHVHLVLVPSTAEALHQSLKVVHGRYAQRVNRMRHRTGHLWQGRYFSSPLDGDYFLNAVRYVELNPVRAGIVGLAEQYNASSAAAHCGLRKDTLIDPTRRPRSLAGIGDWSRWLASGIADDVVDTLRRHASQNLPCGSSEFIAQLERKAGRDLKYRPRGVNVTGDERSRLQQQGDASIPEASPRIASRRK